jgi:hypothetical protein
MSDREMPGMAQEVWRKSSHSGGGGSSSCVEVAYRAEVVGVRDSKKIDGPTLTFTPVAWRGFVRKTT